MMRGFVVGSLALIVFYTVVQQGAANKTEQASNVIVAGLKRFLSPATAGIGNHAQPPAAQPASASTTGKYFTA